MREILYTDIVAQIQEICIEGNYTLSEEIQETFKNAIKIENNDLAKSILQKCLINADIALKESIPLCQDTGLAIFFIKLGVEVKICGKSPLIYDAINEGVQLAYENAFFRKSVLSDPLFDRKNTNTNTPAIIHLEIVLGNNIEIVFFPKGGGAENMSALKMLTPSDGVKGVIDFALDTVIKAGGNPCPPIVVGIGIGGNFEESAILSKKALLRSINKRNSDSRYAELESTILERINNTGIGPQGLGGKNTAFAVNIEWLPCHLASLPIAININCHSHRIVKRVI